MVMLSLRKIGVSILHNLHLVFVCLCCKVEKQPKKATPTKSRCRMGESNLHLLLAGFLYKS